MNTKLKKAVESYQCCGCIHGGNAKCYAKSEHSNSCGNHIAGTAMMPVGVSLFLGLPCGFNRVVDCNRTKINIYNNFQEFSELWGYDRFNVPVWKYKDENKNVIIRGYCPRNDYSFIHIILENCISKIDCIEITKSEIEDMD